MEIGNKKLSSDLSIKRALSTEVQIMKHQKSPVAEPRDPGYPPRDETEINRREILGLLTGGIATAFLCGCGQDPDDKILDELSTLTMGIPRAGERIPLAEIVRIPENREGHTILLPNSIELSYAVAMSTSTQSRGEMQMNNSQRNVVLKSTDEFLRGYSREHKLENQQDLDLAAKAFISSHFADFGQFRPKYVAFELIRVRKLEIIGGLADINIFADE